MSFRIEKKFRLTKFEQESIKKDLIIKGIREIYPKRIINSCYFDTHDLKCFYDSDEGILPRKKIRLRWYKNKEKITKEIKVSLIEGRFKTSEKFYDYKFLEKFNYSIYDKIYGILNPKIIVSYYREYYLLKNIRITFDSNIKYTNLNGLNKFSFKDQENVMEVKADFNNSLSKLGGFIDFPSSRFSKYCRGIFLSKII
tara:strand:+ start:463 stop:1056 length:594 start_codon:yes stop_codon:yes gene_type:complete